MNPKCITMCPVHWSVQHDHHLSQMFFCYYPVLRTGCLHGYNLSEGTRLPVVSSCIHLQVHAETGHSLWSLQGRGDTVQYSGSGRAVAMLNSVLQKACGAVAQGVGKGQLILSLKGRCGCRVHSNQAGATNKSKSTKSQDQTRGISWDSCLVGINPHRPFADKIRVGCSSKEAVLRFKSRNHQATTPRPLNPRTAEDKIVCKHCGGQKWCKVH